ncbi:hypothetical protein V5799_030086 [Amblyomma americanum]|uniref:Uncharacterized protein n=1 Tax=Amblyomma americanum TaxID=6943 RepID=A0AAQ4EP92_AMBAM
MILLPLLQYGGSLYCLLLPLLLWAFNSLPKAGAALVHLVTLPLFGLMAPEKIARQYLSTEVLTVALVLFLVIVVDRWSELVLSLAYGVCARFGLQRKWLFFGTCLCSFAFAWLFSGPLVSVTLLYFLDRLMSTIYKGNMDRAPDGLPRSPRRGSVQESSSLRSLSEADQVLFDRLAKLAMSMKKPERRKWRNRHPLEEHNESDAAAAPTASGTDAALKTLPSVIRDSDSSVSASLVPAAPGHQPWTKQAVEETTASCSVPGSRSNLPSQNFGSAKSDSENTTAKPADKVSRQESAVAAEEKTGERLIHSIGQVASASALGDANKEGKMEFQGAHQDDNVSWSKLCQTEDRRTTSRNELPGSVSRKSMDKPFDNRPRNSESKGAQGEHPERLERVLPAAVDEEPCNTGSAANPSQNICQQEDTKAFERFRNKEDGQSNGAKSYTAAIIDTKPQQSITENEEPGLKDPEQKTETCPRKGSNDSLGKPLLQNSYRKNIASAHWDGLEPVLDEKQDNCSCKTSGTDASFNEDRSNAKKASSNVTAEKKHRTHEASGHKVVPAKTEHKSGVRATEGPHSTHTDDHPEKRKEMQCRKRGKDSLKNQPHHHHTPRRKSKGSNGQQVEVLPAQQPRHPPRYISKGDRRDASSGGTRGSTDSGSEKTELAVKRQNSLPNKHVYDEHPPVQLEASRPETTADPVAQSMRGSTSERHHGNYADSQSDVSRRSKTAVKIHHGSDVPDAKEHLAGTLKAMTAEDGSEKRADKRLSREDASSKFTAEKPLQSAGPAASEETRRSQNSKLVSGAVPPKKQPQNFTSGTSAPKASALDGAEITSTMELKRKQSVVSFGADLFGAIQPQPELSAVHTLVIEAFSMVPSSFWEERTLLEVQTLLAFAAAIMAEGADKRVIVEIMMPVVGHISEMKQMYPAYYAIPVVVGASSNVIMPSSVPMALLHDLSRVPFWKMLLLGLFSKTVVMSMVIVTVNVMDRVGLLGTDAPHD